MNRRTEKLVITIETRQQTRIYKRRQTITMWCRLCAEDVSMISPNEAAALFSISARAIFRLTEKGEIHFLENELGALLICRNSCRSHSQSAVGQI